jgi:Peptidase family M28
VIESGRALRSALTVVLVGVVSAAAIWQTHPPRAVPATAPAVEFSSARALAHLRAFARQPHPIGSGAQNAVRAYLVAQIAALGVQPQVETTPVAVDARPDYPLEAGTVSDVIARLPGTANTRALALMAHYDSVPSGPGAADDGEGVAVLLETLRALRASPPLRNDVIFLFTDGEEAGLLGSKAFVDAHPGDVGLALNFEARGTGGPGMLFETSGGNGWMVRQFAAVAPHPLGSSLSYEAYRRMPNDTDLTVFKKAGIAGLNFAFIDGVTRYHTHLDDVRYLDKRSLQHQGSYALSLARRFGNLDLSHVTAADATFFDMPGLGMVVYPIGWSLPLALIAAVALAALIGLGLTRGRISTVGTLLGFIAFFGAMIVAGIAAEGVWLLVLAWRPDYQQMLMGDPYHANIYRAACVALVIALFAALYRWLMRRMNLTGLWAGALLLWLALSLLSAVFVPGGSYAFTWPLLFSLAGLAFVILRGEKLASWLAVAVLWACAIPSLLMVAPMIQQLFVAMTMRMAFIPALVTVLLLGLLLPLLEIATAPRGWWLPTAAALVCAGCLVAGAATGYDRDHPKPDSLFYGLDADTGAATWFSGDERPDPWTVPVLGVNPKRVSSSPYFPYLTWKFYVNPASAVPLAPPLVERLQDNTSEGVRFLLLRIVSERHAPAIGVYGDPSAQVLSAEVNGKPLGSGTPAPDKPGLSLVRFHRWSFSYANPPREGIELRIRLKTPAAPYCIEVIDQSYGLDGLPGVPTRPVNTMPLAWTPDSILVRKSYSF